MGKKQILKATKKLNRENYYSNEMDWRYMSATYFKKFLECEASAMNELDNPVEDKSDALIQGNYLHTYFEGKEAHERFINEYHDNLYTNKGEKYAVTKKTDLMIKALDTDDFFHYVYQGEREVILDGELYGYPWKARIDCLNVKRGYFVDLKTTRDLHKSYGYLSEEHRHKKFTDEYNYALQMGVYKKLLQQKYRKPFKAFIIAVDKQAIPDKTAIEMPFELMMEQLKVIEDNIDRVADVMRGDIEPKRCEICDYCRLTKKMTGFIDPRDL